VKTVHVRVRKVAQRRSPAGSPGPRARAKKAERATGPLLPSYDVLLRGGTGMRAGQVVALQRAVGNRQVAQLLANLTAAPESPRRSPDVAVGYGAMSGLHGRTEGTFDGGKKAIADLKTAPATGCDCPPRQACLTATATLVVTYKVAVTISMPPMPGGLTACKQKRVAAFLAGVLRPHEQEHKRRFETYNGVTRRPVEARGCGRSGVKTEIDNEAEKMHDQESTSREDAARKLSDAIDPFFRVVDFEGCK
jgi:hypothetical protein